MSSICFGPRENSGLEEKPQRSSIVLSKNALMRPKGRPDTDGRPTHGQFHDDGLIAQLFAVEDGYGFAQLHLILQIRVGERRRNAGDGIVNDSNGFRLYSARFNPTHEFILRAVVRNVHEEKLGCHGDPALLMQRCPDVRVARWRRDPLPVPTYKGHDTVDTDRKR